jgi:PilZ domain
MRMPADRHPTKEVASLEFYGKSGSLIADVKNLSKTGACIEWSHSDVEVSQGDLVRLTILLKALNRKHHVTAEVVWRRGRMSGLSFISQAQILEKMMQK